ncbi:isochorismatase family protein [Mesorhizobium sp. VNQ89]|uniref:isochorismatase family protein n=1 Tax=Mesorhizobium quangtriensis TaxID=3157709 RepID=UPI0032B796C1
MRRPLSIDVGKTALLCIDLQEEHRKDERYLVDGFDVVLRNTRSLQEAARRAGISVLHFSYVVDVDAATTRRFHPRMADGSSAFSDKDDPLSAICPEVAPDAGEQLIVKTGASAFATGFGDDLQSSDVEWLIVAGVWTEACVDATVKDALKRDLRVLLVKDACGSGSVAMHQTGVLNLANRLFGGAVVDTNRAIHLLNRQEVEAWTPASPVPIRYDVGTLAEFYKGL